MLRSTSTASRSRSVLRLVHELGLEEALARGDDRARELVARAGLRAARRDPADVVPPQARRRGIPLGGQAPPEEPSTARAGPLPPGDPDRAEARGAGHRPAVRCRPSRSSARWSSTCPSSCAAKRPARRSSSAPARLPLWFDYFSNDNLLYQINNRLGAEAVARALPAARRRRSSRSAAARARPPSPSRERLARDAALSRIGRYVFTEIVPDVPAARGARHSGPLPGAAGRVRAGSTWTATSPSRASPRRIADVVYAVNTVHIARDLAATLARIRETLKPGGVGGLLGVRAPVRRPADLRRVRLQLPRELHGRGDRRRRRGPTTAS